MVHLQKAGSHSIMHGSPCWTHVAVCILSWTTKHVQGLGPNAGKTQFNQQKGRHNPKTELKQSIIQTAKVVGVWCLNRPSGWATAVCVCVCVCVCE